MGLKMSTSGSILGEYRGKQDEGHTSHLEEIKPLPIDLDTSKNFELSPFPHRPLGLKNFKFLNTYFHWDSEKFNKWALGKF